ncbi:hypothetical protein BDA96_10G126000 [Sorghum bicolor]|uniref:Uncharacterized protein n=1 Tax=Sorghum bicolor TaxID=4558 RepID=A0A921U0H7_SORBI|nr:hypothetical protein BDA96_10G126000 [Sorghum bicolor]
MHTLRSKRDRLGLTGAKNRGAPKEKSSLGDQHRLGAKDRATSCHVRTTRANLPSHCPTCPVTFQPPLEWQLGEPPSPSAMLLATRQATTGSLHHHEQPLEHDGDHAQGLIPFCTVLLQQQQHDREHMFLLLKSC